MQDELIFDGGSVILDERGEVVARGEQFAAELLVADLDLAAVLRQQLHDPRWRRERARQQLARQPSEAVEHAALETVVSSPQQPFAPARIVPLKEPLDEVYQALVLGTRDYVLKNGFGKAVIGLSGGIDSALTAAVAAEALGPENVTGVFMPSRYSSVESRKDATLLAENLGIGFLTIAIDGIFQVYLDTLIEPFAGCEPDVTEENIQRIEEDRRLPITNRFRDAKP